MISYIIVTRPFLIISDNLVAILTEGHFAVLCVLNLILVDLSHTINRIQEGNLLMYILVAMSIEVAIISVLVFLSNLSKTVKSFIHSKIRAIKR